MAKKIIFSFIPIILIILTAELVCRIKYCVDYKDYRWLYIPFNELGPKAAPPLDKSEQKVIKIQTKASIDSVYSPCRGKMLVQSYNDYGWRGRMFSKIKPESIYRILIVGGSSAESVITGDEDSWYYLLLESLDSDSLLKGKIEVINAGVSGNNSKLINEQLQKQGFELKPDLILYYEAHNDIHLVTPWFKHLDTKIGLLAKSHLIHRLLHYRSMLYTYLVEKYFFTKMKITQWRIDEKLTSENFKSIITNCKKRSIDFVYIRQANNFPLEKDGKNLTDEHDLRELIKIYSEKKTIGEDKTRLSEEWSELMVFLQRLLLVIQTKICWLENIEVIDPLPAFEAARKDSLVLFQGHGNKTNFGVHTTCEGDKILAKCVFDGIKQKVENGVSYFAVK